MLCIMLNEITHKKANRKNDFTYMWGLKNKIFSPRNNVSESHIRLLSLEVLHWEVEPPEIWI